MCVGLPTCMSVKHMSAVLQDQQKESGPLELALQTGKSLPMVMGIESRLSGRPASALNY